MGRHKIYLTTEAKQEANRAKSKRSYEKHRISTNERRRKLYQTKEATQSPVATTVNTEKPVPNVPACVQQVANIQKSIETLLNKQPACIYLDTLRHKYMLVLNDASIREAVTKMLHYQDTVHRYQDVLLQLVGPQSEEWKKADTVRQSVRQLVQGLEDLETYTMLGRNEMQEGYQSRNLMYQSW